MIPERRRGAFAAGELVQLTDPKGKLHTIELVPGKICHTHRGQLPHDDIIGQPDGSVFTSTNGSLYLALRPLLDDFVLSMPRGAAVVYPKDAARIVGLASLGPGARVVEAGVGSGALSCSLIRAVGTQGTLHSYERREDFAAIAIKNVSKWFGKTPDNWRVTVGDLALDCIDREVDAVILDMLAPWDCLNTAAEVLLPGGVLVAYVATATQMSKVVETARVMACWTEPRAEESLVRTWHLDGLSVRPDHRMNGHTGFLVTCRRLAPGAVLPPRRRRPAAGAYGEDYSGPGALPDSQDDPTRLES